MTNDAITLPILQENLKTVINQGSAVLAAAAIKKIVDFYKKSFT
jgi:hypothetical protein